MKELNRFNTPISVKLVAYLFLLLSPLILYLILFKFHFFIQHNVWVKGIIINKEIIIKKEDKISYKSIQYINVINQKYKINKVLISQKNISFFVNVKLFKDNSKINIEFNVKEKKTLIDFFFS